jgi:hypothetical protein
MKRIILNSFLFIAIAIAFTACEKTELKDGGGKTLISFTGGGGDPIVLPLDIDPTVEEIEIVGVNKNAKNQAELGTATSVNISNTQAFLDSYNDQEGTAFELLPSDAYTITAASGVTVSGDKWTVNFAPGEFAKSISITLDKSKLDFSKSYAFGLQVLDASGATVSAERGTIIVNPLVKNQYHGSYHATGVFHHPTNGDRDIDEDKELITSGATSVRAPLGDLGGSGYYMILNVNADNTVTITPSGATPNINQTWGPNYYDPAEKAFHLFYSYNTSAPRKVEETIKLK